MFSVLFRVLAVLTMLTMADPAYAQTGAAIAVPEPADFVLFTAGVIGLLIGRQSSRKRRHPDD